MIRFCLSFFYWPLFCSCSRAAAASISSAVEIAKKYEDEKVVSFLNGILGAFVRAEFPEETKASVSETTPTEEG